MSLHDVWKLCFSFFRGKQVSVEPAEENISTDAGLLILRQFDEQQGLTVGFTEQLEDPRRKPEHPLLEMVRSRVFGILAGYEDQNDHDALRSDAIFKVIADRSPDDDDLASQPTLSRFENSVTAKDLLRLEEEFIERFVNSFAEPPREITLDIDVFDDPTHGDQQLTFFHGFYDQYQYLVRAITCAENDMVVLPVLLFGTADPSLGVVTDLERVVTRLREKFPDVLIRLRADSGFARPALYEACERLRVEYSIGLGMNQVLKRQSEELLELAVKQQESTGEPQRLFTAFDYQASTWSSLRWVVVKCEANAKGTNRRAVVTNRPGARTLPPRCVRGIRRARRKREPQQGTEMRFVRGSAERSSIPGQLLPHVPALLGEQLVGPPPTDDCCTSSQRTDAGHGLPRPQHGHARTASPGSPHRTRTSPGFQSTSGGRSVGRRPPLHLADACHQGRRTNPSHGPSHPCFSFRFLAVS